MKKNTLNLIFVVAGLLAFGFLFWEYTRQFLATILMGVIAELIAIFLSEFALYVFTEVKFSRYWVEGDDEKIQSYERGWVMRLAGEIFLAVHILFAVIIAGVYFAQFN